MGERRRPVHDIRHDIVPRVRWPSLANVFTTQTVEWSRAWSNRCCTSSSKFVADFVHKHVMPLMQVKLTKCSCSLLSCLIEASPSCLPPDVRKRTEHANGVSPAMYGYAFVSQFCSDLWAKDNRKPSAELTVCWMLCWGAAYPRNSLQR